MLKKKTIDTITFYWLLDLFLLETVGYWTLLDFTGNWSPSFGSFLKPINPNGICPKTHYRKPYFNGFNG